MDEIDEAFTQNSFEHFYEIYQRQDFQNSYFDVIFHVQGKELYAHSLILAQESPVFNEMFIKNRLIRNEPIIIDDYCYNEFYEFLRCIYSPYLGLEILDKMEFSVIELAELYKVERIKQCLCDYYYLDIKNDDIEQILTKIELAYKFSLKGYGFRMDLERRILQLVESDGFVHLEKFVLEAFIFFTKSYHKKADEICKGIYKWGEYRAMISDEIPEKEKNELVLTEIKDFLKDIKFESMTVKFLFDFAIKKGLISIKEVIKNASSCCREVSKFEELCESVYKWGENQAKITEEMSEKEKNQLVSNEIKDFIPFLKFEQMSIKFLLDFALKKELISMKNLIKNISSSSERKFFDNEELCKSIYKWGEYRAMISEEMSEKEKNELVLIEIQELIPLLPYEKVSIKFLFDFVVKKNLLSMDQACKYKLKYVQIKTRKGSTLDGSFVDDYGIWDYSLKSSLFLRVQNKNKASCKDYKFKIPSIPSTIEKMKGCEWYLLFEKDGTLAVKHESLIDKKEDYLIAEMKSKQEFNFFGNGSFYLQISHNNF